VAVRQEKYLIITKYDLFWGGGWSEALQHVRYLFKYNMSSNPIESVNKYLLASTHNTCYKASQIDKMLSNDYQILSKHL